MSASDSDGVKELKKLTINERQPVRLIHLKSDEQPIYSWLNISI